MLSVAVVGGLTSVTGAILGTIVVVAIPIVFSNTQELQLFASGLGMLILLMYVPGGLISVLQSGRDMLLEYVARRTNWEPQKGRATSDITTLSTRDRSKDVAADSGTPVLPLRTDDVQVRFGGVFAVNGVSLEVRPGEVVGLIGTNGAGKSTLMNAISGTVKSSGTVEVFGDRLDGMAPYRRARHGMGRSFQNARIFGGLTVRETLMVALEARERSLLIPSLTGLPPSPFAERRKHKQAEAIVSYLGLGRYADNLLSELSTGSRRIVELGALLALDTRLMLLDEPTAGVAQRETEAFGPLDQGDPAGPRLRHPHHRARHAHGDVDQRPDLLPRSRRSDRRGEPRRGAGQPCGDRVVPRHRPAGDPAVGRRRCGAHGARGTRRRRSGGLIRGELA